MIQVVITGVGTISSVGTGSDSHYKALLDGTSGIDTLPEWADEYPCKVSVLRFYRALSLVSALARANLIS